MGILDPEEANTYNKKVLIFGTDLEVKNERS